MERERKRTEQQQQQQQVSLLQQHLQMSSSTPATTAAAGDPYQQQQQQQYSAPAVNIPGVGARIKEIPTEVLKVRSIEEEEDRREGKGRRCRLGGRT